MNSEYQLEDSDFSKHFREWLHFDHQAITWEGQYSEEFNQFWSLLFSSNPLLSEQIKRFNFLLYDVSSGPLHSWFLWLRNNFLVYLFIKKSLSLEQLSEQSNIDINSLAQNIREFFCIRFPHLENQINQYFIIGNILSPNLALTFDVLSRQLGLNQETLGSMDDEIMNTLEVTLYPDFSKVHHKLKNHLSNKKFNLENLKKRNSFQKQVRFLQELSAVFFIAVVLLFAFKYGNQFYEKYIIDKISLYKPDIFWSETDLIFSEKNEQPEIELSLFEIEKLEQLESIEEKNEIEETRFDVESDVVLTSIDQIPKDFDIADKEQSEYEEVDKGGYRDSSYGFSRAYRILMNSNSPRTVRSKLNQLLKAYKVSKVGTVEPGTEIPGGIYYNLYVDQKQLNHFLENVTGIEQSSIYLSKTNVGNLPGMNRVFIWIKSI